jgi:hypothetical protein
MDTTYFGRAFGVMLFLDTFGNRLYWKYVKYETVSGYLEGIRHIEEQGVKIKGIVCDGRRGLFSVLEQYLVQMCQFHQVAIVTRYLTRRPKLQASIELRNIVQMLSLTDKESFYGLINDWVEKWKDFINERAINPETGKTRYIHKRLRGAYRSIKRNLPFLFTWYDNIEVGIPNTNNQLEGTFTALKNKLRNHNGLSRKRKEKFIDGFLRHKRPK